MTSKYAEGTTVSVGRSRDELERTLERFGANGQSWMRDDEKGITTMAFRRRGKTYMFTIAVPPLADFVKTPSKRYSRSQEDAKVHQDAELRRRFRSLANYIKALLDATDTGIIKAEEALLPYLVLPGGKTFYEEVVAGRQISLPPGE